MTLRADVTFFIEGSVNLFGKTIIEPTVVKYTNYQAGGPALPFFGEVEFRTTPWSPAVFTSESDDTVGQVLPWSTGNPTNFCGNPALEFNYYASGVLATGAHLRISHAASALSFYTGHGHRISHAQFVHCDTAILPYYATVEFRNVLDDDVGRLFSGSAGTSTGRVEHLTASRVNLLNYQTNAALALTNSLLANVTNLTSFAGGYNATNSGGTNVFQSLGAANFYLQPMFSAMISGQAAGTLVAFHIEATDKFGATSWSPNDAPARECLVRFGEPPGAGTFGTYRLWMTAQTASNWATRLAIHNGPLDATFVYNSNRVVYNVGAFYNGSDVHSPNFDSPTNNLCGYVLHFPSDDQFLGAKEASLDWASQDDSGQREPFAYWLASQLGVPFCYQRYIHLLVNGRHQ